MKEIKNKILGYLRETQAEIKKVAWPQRQYVMAATIMVLAIVIVVGIIITLLDIGLSKIVMFLTKAF